MYCFLQKEMPGPSCYWKKELDFFSTTSGLIPNALKSEFFVAGDAAQVITLVRSIWDLGLGSLPVKYLGAPLITRRLKVVDCRPLIDKVTRQTASCANRSLSYAGRLFLIKSILLSIQVFYSCAFMLPKEVTVEVEGICRRFLWKGPSLNSGDAKIAGSRFAFQPRREDLDSKHSWMEQGPSCQAHLGYCFRGHFYLANLGTCQSLWEGILLVHKST